MSLTLIIINCTRHDGSGCAAGHFGGQPSPGSCAHCPHRQPVDPGQPVTSEVPIASPMPEERVAVPRDKWPLWAKAVEKFAEPDDIGVGSTIQRVLGKPGMTYKAFRAAVGLPCRCAERRDEWDTLYSYVDD